MKRPTVICKGGPVVLLIDLRELIHRLSWHLGPKAAEAMSCVAHCLYSQEAFLEPVPPEGMHRFLRMAENDGIDDKLAKGLFVQNYLRVNALVNRQWCLEENVHEVGVQGRLDYAMRSWSCLQLTILP